MLESLIHILKRYGEIDYRIVQEKTLGAESYYVKHELEMNRVVDVLHIYLTVYKTFEKEGKTYRGSAQTEIHPTMNEEDCIAVVEDAIYAAGFVENEFYPLPKPQEGSVLSRELDLFGELQKMKNVVFAHDTFDKGYLSYSEFFAKKKEIRVVNSQGVDVTFFTTSMYVETAVNWKEDVEIELTESYTMSECDEKAFGERIARLFEIASKKPQAQKTPLVVDTNILLSGECLRSFFEYYYQNANAQKIYRNESTFSVGQHLQGEDVRGDTITMVLDPLLKGSCESREYDSDGVLLKPVTLIQDGCLKQFWGDVRFSSYLGIEPTGQIGNFVVRGGSYSIEDLKKEPYLELVSFSDFQMDQTTGDFASEIRLGFYFDGKETVSVTSGSISGNIKNVEGTMKMSREMSYFNNYYGPTMISIRNVSIAGS